MQLMKYAVIKNGIVENICLWDGNKKTWTPPADVEMVDVSKEFIDLGWEYKNKKFTVPKVKDKDMVS